MESPRSSPFVTHASLCADLDWARIQTNGWDTTVQHDLSGTAPRTSHVVETTVASASIITAETERNKLKRMASHLLDIVLADETKKSRFLDFYDELVPRAASASKEARLVNPSKVQTGKKRRNRNADL